jgi:hypothetical protein
MNLAPQFPASRPASSVPSWLVCLVALTGCGGATYSIGTVPGDGGKDAEGGGVALDCSSLGGDGCEGGSGFSFGGDDGGSTLGFGGDGSSGFAFDDGGSVVSAECTQAPISCSAGASGYACPPGGIDPTQAQPNLSCTSGAIVGYQVEFCCIPWPSGTACAPDESSPCDGYPYQCVAGHKPSDVDSNLSCGTGFPDSNGEVDFCCTYP